MISTQFLLTALVVVLAPGTGVIYTLAIGLGQGRKAAIWAAFGCTIGIFPALVAASLGLAAVLHTSALLFHLVKFAGVAYLLYLAWQALRDGGALSLGSGTTTQTGWKICKRAALINILNPKLSIFFLALLPPFLSGTPAQAPTEMAILGGIFMVMTFFVFMIYGLFAAQTRRFLLGSDTAVKWMRRSFAAVFVLLAGKLATERA
ncbi:LysE family translocator [Cognatishimia sp. WU-CL00825]|uniref:LysE family translocator n=1 Tax=Cognatishimia sp. WU-CL00825 TaxID=3127658 RepID=UPI00310891C1